MDTIIWFGSVIITIACLICTSILLTKNLDNKPLRIAVIFNLVILMIQLIILGIDRLIISPA